MEEIKKEKNRSQSQTITLDIKLRVPQDINYIKKRIFKSFGRTKPGSHSRAIALDLRSSVFLKTHGFEVSYETPVPGVLIIKNGNVKL